MNATTLFFLLLVLACPLMMIWMMRGHGAHGHGAHGGLDHDSQDNPESSLLELRRRRAELDALIAEREAEEPEAEDTERTPALAGKDQ